MLLVRPTALSVLDWASERPFGLDSCGADAGAVRFIIAFLLMDLAFYWWHVANHRIPFLWRFHNVHHIDPDLDVSTAFRFHVGEVALSTAFRIVQVSVIGLSAWMFAVYEIVFQANTLFHHSNVRLPIGDRAPAQPGDRHASHARDPPLAGTRRNELEFFGRVLLVGQAAPDARAEYSAGRDRDRGPWLCPKRGQLALERASAAFSPLNEITGGARTVRSSGAPFHFHRNGVRASRNSAVRYFWRPSTWTTARG